MPIALILGLAVAIGFGSGWGVKGWKDEAQIAQVNTQKAALVSRMAIVDAANVRCAIDVEGVKKSMAIIVSQADEREKAASDAMKAADLKIAERRARIRISRLPQVAATRDAQCEAMIQEQIDYVRERTQ